MNNCKFGEPDILKVKFAWCYGKFGAASAVLKLCCTDKDTDTAFFLEELCKFEHFFVLYTFLAGLIWLL